MAEDQAVSPMSVLLKDAIQPNLVQTLEERPALAAGRLLHRLEPIRGLGRISEFQRQQGSGLGEEGRLLDQRLERLTEAPPPGQDLVRNVGVLPEHRPFLDTQVSQPITLSRFLE